MTTTKITPADAGCWLEGSRGWRISADVVRLAADYGLGIDAADRGILRRYEAGDPDGEDSAAIDAMADEATDYLDRLAPAGYGFEWIDGELFMLDRPEDDD
jgi:hypothetical protein